MTDSDAAARIDRLLDAIDLLKENRRQEARVLLRELIREDSNFEEAWLWMSVAVDSLDQSSVCLDNVLRVNPKNYEAAAALFRIRAPELKIARERTRLRFFRDMVFGIMWFIVLTVLFSAFFAIVGGR